MLNIYAASFLTATRTPGVTLRDVPPINAPRRRRWFAPRPKANIDITNL